MDWLHYIQQKLQTWQGMLASLMGSAAALLGMMKVLPRTIKSLRELHGGALFLMEIRQHLDEVRRDVKTGFSRTDDQMVNLLQMHQHLLDTNPNPWFISDERGLTVWVNRRFRQLTGLDVYEAKGRGWEIGVAPEERARVSAAWDQAITHERPFEEAVTYIDRDGNRTRVQITATPNRLKDGRITGWMGHAAAIEQEAML